MNMAIRRKKKYGRKSFRPPRQARLALSNQKYEDRCTCAMYQSVTYNDPNIQLCVDMARSSKTSHMPVPSFATCPKVILEDGERS